MESWVACAFFLVAVVTPSESLTCYSCAGEDSITAAISSVVANLPGVSSLPNAAGLAACGVQGSTCSGNLYCTKQATQRLIYVGSTMYSNSIYTKGCSSVNQVTLSNSSVVAVQSGQCYQLSTSVSNGITTNNIQCFCNNANDCNGAAAKIASVLVIVLAVIVSTFANSG